MEALKKTLSLLSLFLILSITTSLLLLAGCKAPPTKTDAQPGGPEHGFLPPPVWNASMQSLQQSIVQLKPFVFDQKKFSSEENFAFLKKEIHKLAAESQNVKHDPLLLTKDPTAKFVAAQFADELKRADENFSTGWPEFARWQLARVTSYCLECHVRLREGVAFSSSETNSSFVSTLPAPEQIEFMIAFRQFEPAYNLSLKKLNDAIDDNDKENVAERVARLGLLVSVQYLQDRRKALYLTEQISKMRNLPLYLRKSNEDWKKSISAWNDQERIDNLPQVRELLKNRKSEVDDMRAISALLRVLGEGLNREELGEALLLTGQSYESLHRISIMSLHENYYESCVSRAPQTKWAKICFAKLSDSITAGYSGSSGTRIPKSVKDRLEQIEKLIDVKNHPKR